ncbi:UDP-N-acetylmuramate dehydrogenase [Raineyella antarctica]|uniref:UDP-N-acetylenolpyruvoylglucosamine reductase n=1 Tax=Raineyella antarctica TaxID=1577474 RepID=A0A1G6HVW1_9ACTN|nr:UDP-N-acetylmuramate dehydrogenase [Raineyella antarctica]SDB98278.1 UDP-N-acetylmuramate dehydrogenase [Raineyella antarctica]
MAELLSDHTTFHLGGPAARYEVARDDATLVRLVSEADATGEPVLVLGGGSNLLIGDEGFDGLVVEVATSGLSFEEVSSCAGANVTVAAGESWDGFVAEAVERQWRGPETLSGIPGKVGAVPIQNVGAYGSEVSQYIVRVRTWDRQEGRQRTFFPFECRFGYRNSMFKEQPGRWIILDVSFQFLLGDLLSSVRYQQLADKLGIGPGESARAPQVRQAVLELRAGKGMVLDPEDHDTWSAGSFFTNPVLPEAVAAALPEGAPRYPAGPGEVKTSAAWLIEHAGFPKGWHLPRFGSGEAPAALSGKHTLALTNRGSATTADVVELAARIRAGVREKYGVTLVPEPTLIGCSLDDRLD